MRQKPIFLLASALLLASCGNPTSSVPSSSSETPVSSSASASSTAPTSSSSLSSSSEQSSTSSSVSSSSSSSSEVSSSTISSESSSSSEAQKYSVLIIQSPLATLTADKRYAAEGETVTVTASLEERAYLSYITVNKTNVYETADYSGVFVFTMPAEEVKITYEAKQGYLLTLNTENVTATLDTRGVRDNVLCQGWNVIISYSLAEGYHIASFSAVAENGTLLAPYKNEDDQYCFTMPASNVTFTLKAEQDDPRVATWIGSYDTGIALTGSSIKKEGHKLLINGDGSISFTPAGYEMGYSASCYSLSADDVLTANTSTLAEESSLKIVKLGDGVLDLELTYKTYGRTYVRHYVLSKLDKSFMVVKAYDGVASGSYSYMANHLACLSSKSTGVFYAYYDYDKSVGYPYLEAYEDGASTPTKAELSKNVVYALKDGETEIAAVKYDGSNIFNASMERGIYTGESTLVLDGFGTAKLDGKSYSYTGAGSSFTLSGDEEIKVTINSTNHTYEVVKEAIDPFVGTSYHGEMKDYDEDFYMYVTYSVDLVFSSNSGTLSSLSVQSSDWGAKSSKTLNDLNYSFDKSTMKLAIAVDAKKTASFNVKLDYSTLTCGSAEYNKFFYFDNPYPTTMTLSKVK